MGLLLGVALDGVQLRLHGVEVAVDDGLVVLGFGFLELQAADFALQAEYLVLALEDLVLVLPAHLGGRLAAVVLQTAVLVQQLLKLGVEVVCGFLRHGQLLFVEHHRRVLAFAPQ